MFERNREASAVASARRGLDRAGGVGGQGTPGPRATRLESPVKTGEPGGRESRAAAPGTPAAVLDAWSVGDSVRVLQVTRPPAFTFQAGQHVKVGVSGAGHNTYSIASAPHEPHLEFCIERVPGGRLSPRLCALRAGDGVTVGARAKGSFQLASGMDVHLIVVTATGIAPFRSMLRDVFHRRSVSGQLIVLHGGSHAEDLPYREELEALAGTAPDRLRYVPTVSRPEAPQNRGYRGETGRVDALAARMAPAFRGRKAVQAYACGNPGMIANVARLMAELSLPLATEAFG